MTINQRNLSAAPISLIRTTPPTPQWIGEEIKNTLQDVLQEQDLSTLLRYHRFAGTERDREVGAIWMSHRLGCGLDANRILATNGTQNALLLALATAVGNGGLVLVEELSYYGFRRLAGFLNVEVDAIAMDRHGALPDAFQHACRTRSPKALFLTPTIHNPTTLVMSLERRNELIDIARRYGVAIIEDDVYGSLPTDAPPPIAALAPDITWYASGLAKCVSPGLKAGYLVAPSAVHAAAVFERFQVTSTWHMSPLSAVLVDKWVSAGIATRILDAVRAEASARQEIARELLAGSDYAAHPNGLHLWLTLPAQYDQETFVTAAANAGVVLRPGSMFAFHPTTPVDSIRIVLGSPETRDELLAGLSALKTLLQ
ncbi:PLP-dependent aminotransferase family protein [Mesorhizobium sp. NPDC059054]|uniref:aminotransferase-like domain-containing protein n=1 Tax=Mesorhizobium sp. NPDC059054 TaxID=3346711 RepID=UPI003692BC84